MPTEDIPCLQWVQMWLMLHICNGCMLFCAIVDPAKSILLKPLRCRDSCYTNTKYRTTGNVWLIISAVCSRSNMRQKNKAITIAPRVSCINIQLRKRTHINAHVRITGSHSKPRVRVDLRHMHPYCVYTYLLLLLFSVTVTLDVAIIMMIYHHYNYYCHNNYWYHYHYHHYYI